MRLLIKMISWIAAIAGGLFVLIVLYLYFNQGNMIFLPSSQISCTPEEFGMNYEDVYIALDSGERIHGWYLGSTENSRTVLFLHGNAGNISSRISTIQMLASLDLNVLIIDYRGYGLSDGNPSEHNVFADSRAAYDWLLSEKGVEPSRLFLFGRSLGGAAAIDLAVQAECAGLIVESSFTSITDMGRLMYPFVPISALLRHRFESLEKIGRVGCPILISHSPEDDLIPYEMGRKLYEAAAEPKRFVEISGGHNDLECLSDAAYLTALSEFLQSGR